MLAFNCCLLSNLNIFQHLVSKLAENVKMQLSQVCWPANSQLELWSYSPSISHNLAFCCCMLSYLLWVPSWLGQLVSKPPTRVGQIHCSFTLSLPVPQKCVLHYFKQSTIHFEWVGSEEEREGGYLQTSRRFMYCIKYDMTLICLFVLVWVLMSLLLISDRRLICQYFVQLQTCWSQDQGPHNIAKNIAKITFWMGLQYFSHTAQ